MEINIRQTPVYLVRSRDGYGHEHVHSVHLSSQNAIGTAAAIINEFNVNYLGKVPFHVEIVVTQFNVIRDASLDRVLTNEAYRAATIHKREHADT